MNRRSNIGHLIAVKNAATGKSEFLFLFIRGDEPLRSQLAVLNGIRNIVIPDQLRGYTKISADTVTDFSRIEQDYPETKGRRIWELPILSFFDEKNNVFKESLFLSGVRSVVEKDGDFFPANRLTAVATGSDFFDRENLIADIWDRIGQNRNILLCAPRRYGKTSVMRHLEATSGKHGYHPVIIDLESIRSPEEFVARLYGEIYWHDEPAEEKNRKTEAKEKEIEGRWKEEGEALFQALSGQGQRHLFLFDECPYMLDTFLGKDNEPGNTQASEAKKALTQEFVGWFKKMRELSNKSCAYLLTGSIDIKTYLQDHDLKADDFSDANEVRLTYFDPRQIRTYVEALLLGEGIHLADDILEKIAGLSRPGIPYFIQILINHVTNLHQMKPDFSGDELDKVYREKIIGPDGRRHFDTFERHFKRYGIRERGARALLRILAHAEDDGIEKDKLEQQYRIDCGYKTNSKEFHILLSYLEHDFYIECPTGAGRCRFASPMLKDYWRKNQ